MSGRAAAWHASDVASYDVAVELTNALTAYVLQGAAEDDPRATSQIVALRRELQLLDPGDRASVESFTSAVFERIRELTS
jgi:hypothetical protein